MSAIDLADPMIEYAKTRFRETSAKTSEAARFRYALLGLPVLVLRDEGGLSWDRIAEELDVSKATVKRVYKDAVPLLNKDQP